MVYPTPLMNWSGEFYSKVFERVGVSAFALRENDYVFDDKKFAGNAQGEILCVLSFVAFSGDRMLHHTSFLWNYEDEMMKALKVRAATCFQA